MSAGLPRPWIVLVSDRARLCAAAGRPPGEATRLLVEQAAAAAAAGVTAFQVREPDLDTRTLLALVERIAGAAGPRMRVLVNDRADVAAALGVGVHLRATSMPAARVRDWQPALAWITQAVHDVSDLARAAGADALIAGTVRATPSKPASTPTLGLTGLARIASAAPVPVVGIGGLTVGDWPALRQAGAAGLAAIGAFLPGRGETVGDAVRRAMTGVVDSPGGLS